MNELIIPNKENVEKINRIWQGRATQNDFQINILGKMMSINDCGMDFNEIYHGEELLNIVFNKLNNNPDDIIIQIAVILLDSIYHTRLQSPIRFANLIQEKIKKEGLLEKIRNAKKTDEIVKCVDYIATVDKGYNYAYSFATKFCNRINKEQFAIYDSYVAGLLWNYQNIEPYKSCLNGHFNQSLLGRYRSFLDKYRKFREAFSLDNFDYKSLDIFMWTYGKALSWNKTLESNIDSWDVRISPQYSPEYE